MDNLEPITRNEMFLNGDDLEPITREEMILAGADLEPITRHEWFLKKYRGGGGGGGYDLVNVPNLPADIASFNDGTDLPMASLKVAVTPYQDLSHGDPSPENICPIIGWSAVDVSVSGVNVWDEEWINGYYNNGVFVYSADAVCCKNKIPIKPNTTLYYVKNFDITINFYYTFYDKNGDFLQVSDYDWSGRIAKSSSGSISVPNGAYFMTFNMGNGYGATYNNDISINYPSTDTSYHAYNGATYTIDLNGTRYGGTLDATDGTFLDMIDHIASYNGEELPPAWISDRDVYAEGTTPTIGAEVVYTRATPITVQLSPTQVKSLEGENNISANCGQVTEVKYFKKA